MSANATPNRVDVARVGTKAVQGGSTAHGNIGKPDLPYVDIGKPQSADGAGRTRHLHRFA